MDVTIEDEINQALYARALARGAALLTFKGKLKRGSNLYGDDGLSIGNAQRQIVDATPEVSDEEAKALATAWAKAREAYKPREDEEEDGFYWWPLAKAWAEARAARTQDEPGPGPGRATRAQAVPVNPAGTRTEPTPSARSARAGGAPRAHGTDRRKSLNLKPETYAAVRALQARQNAAGRGWYSIDAAILAACAVVP